MTKGEEMSVHVKSVDDFQERVYDNPSSQVTIVDFYADWCGPCKVLSPTLDEIGQEYEGQVNVVKVDVDKFPELGAKYHVRGIPSLLFFKDGEIKDIATGALPKHHLQSFIKPLLA